MTVPSSTNDMFLLPQKTVSIVFRLKKYCLNFLSLFKERVCILYFDFSQVSEFTHRILVVIPGHDCREKSSSFISKRWDKIRIGELFWDSTGTQFMETQICKDDCAQSAAANVGTLCWKVWIFKTSNFSNELIILVSYVVGCNPCATLASFVMNICAAAFKLSTEPLFITELP